MNCLESLGIPAGVTSVVGSGGKTTLLGVLAEDVARRGGHVVLATTTHFMPFDGIPLVTGADEGEVAAALSEGGIACVGTPMRATSNKRGLTGAAGRGDAVGPGDAPVQAASKLCPSPIPVERLAALASHVLLEADGSRRLPLKAHADHEPVVPACSARTVLVVGASGLGRPVREATHRPELFCERAGCAPDDDATPQLVAQALVAEVGAGVVSPGVVVVNQADARPQEALELTACLHALGLRARVLVGSIRSRELREA